MTKLKIDIYSGTIEVEGEVDFVRSVYDDFKDRLLAIRTDQPKYADTAAPDDTGSVATKQKPAASIVVRSDDVDSPVELPVRTAALPARKRKNSTLALMKDLDLSEDGNDLGLADFYAAKAPWTAMESNVVFVYYLQQIMGLTGIGINHIYTCYKFVNVKYPNALKQSLADTSSRKNWLDTSSFEDIKLSAAGENYVEHELPRRAGQ